MKILLTGITGFIGSYLAAKWQNTAYEIIGIGRKNKARPELRIPVIYQDLAKGVLLKEPVDIIVHAAAQSPAPGISSDDFVQSNVNSIRNLIQYARRFGTRKFIYLSSISIYGDPPTALVDENTPIVNPDNYGLTKYLGEMLLSDESEWLSCVALRLPGVIGKGAEMPWLKHVVDKIKRNEKVYIYNPDFLFNNMVHLAELEIFISNLINRQFNGFEDVTLGCKEPMTVRETVNYLKTSLNSTSRIQEKSCKRTSFTISIDKACSMGYRPMSAKQILRKYSLERGKT